MRAQGRPKGRFRSGGYPAASACAAGIGPPRPASGFALLGAVAVLALLTLLAAGGLVTLPMAALRDASREALSVQARAASESGLAMALHRLNTPVPLDAHCEADAQAPGPSWLAHHLDPDPDTTALLAEPVPAASAPPMACRAGTPPTAASVSWSCRCTPVGSSAPAAGPSAVAPGAPQPGFAVGWRTVQDPSGRAVTRLESAGCVRVDGDCLRPPQPGEAPAVRRSVDLAAWPLIERLPAAVLSSGGAIQLGPQVTVGNLDPAAGGRALHAGGAVDLGGALLQGLPGSPASDLGLRHDPALAALGSEGLQQAILGMPASRWRAWPLLGHLDCGGDAEACGQRLAALQEAGGPAALMVEGDLRLPPGLTLGRADRPALLVVRGALQVQGPARVFGLALSDSLQMDGRSGPIRWDGAAVAAGRIEAAGAVLVIRQAGGLDGLTRQPAAVLPRAGSWREGAAVAAGAGS